MVQEELKSLMYVDLSLHGYPKKEKLFDEINLKSCMRLERLQQSISLLVLKTNENYLLFIHNILYPTI